MAGEGLISHIPRRGWQVKPFRQEDLQAFIEIREVMELKALDLGKAKLSTAEAKKELVRIRKSNQSPIEQGGAVSIDNSLHQYLLKLANNPYLNDFFDRHGRRSNSVDIDTEEKGIMDAIIFDDDEGDDDGGDDDDDDCDDDDDGDDDDDDDDEDADDDDDADADDDADDDDDDDG